MPHVTHAMHNNSLDAFLRIDAAGRCEQILEALRELAIATDRQIAERLGLADMNTVRPRITELRDAGRVREVGHQADHVTGRRVRLVEIAP
jgi:DNA-binding Lrp family transcriptional regulator